MFLVGWEGDEGETECEKGQIKINKGFSENLTYPVFFGYPVTLSLSLFAFAHTLVGRTSVFLVWSCVIVNISKFLSALETPFLEKSF